MAHAHANVSSRTALRARCAVRPSRLSTIETAALVAIVLALVIAAAGTARSTADVKLSSVKVESGQSLWQIAREHPVDGLTTAQTVELITEKNQLRDAGVQVGSTLLVPSRSEADALAMR